MYRNWFQRYELAPYFKCSVKDAYVQMMSSQSSSLAEVSLYLSSSSVVLTSLGETQELSFVVSL